INRVDRAPGGLVAGRGYVQHAELAGRGAGLPVTVLLGGADRGQGERAVRPDLTIDQEIDQRRVVGAELDEPGGNGLAPDLDDALGGMNLRPLRLGPGRTPDNRHEGHDGHDGHEEEPADESPHQSLLRGWPSCGLHARVQVTLLILPDRNRTLPSPSPTFIPLLWLDWARAGSHWFCQSGWTWNCSTEAG